MKKFDVALSFAGEQREYAEQIAVLLRGFGVKVFYDNFEQSELWGKDLYQYLHNIYFNASYTVPLISNDYVKKLWTKHELRAMQARAFQENGEYILPIYTDDSELPGLPKTIGYVDLRNVSTTDIALMIVQKLSYSESNLDKRYGAFKDISEQIGFERNSEGLLESLSGGKFATLISVYKDGELAVELDFIQFGSLDTKTNSLPVVMGRNVVHLNPAIGFCGYKSRVLYISIIHKNHPPSTYLIKPMVESRGTVIANNAFNGIYTDISSSKSQPMSARTLLIRTVYKNNADRYYYEGSDIFDAAYPILKNSIGESDAWLHPEHLRAPDLSNVKKLVTILKEEGEVS